MTDEGMFWAMIVVCLIVTAFAVPVLLFIN